eukprot:m.100153 g.100153  ORF g.100153 m.100153 type:complete len:243 (-) comp15116_c0_seq3:1566-2294(-)
MTDSSDSALSLPPDPAHPVLRPCRSLASQAAKRLLLAEGPAATSCGKHACPTCLNANRLKLCLACPTVNYIQAKLCRNKSCRAVFASKHKRSTITSREEYNTKVRLARAAIAKAHALVRDLQHVAPEVELTSFFHAPTPPFIADVAQPDKRPDPKRARVVDNASPHDDEERSKGWLYPMVEVKPFLGLRVAYIDADNSLLFLGWAPLQLSSTFYRPGSNEYLCWLGVSLRWMYCATHSTTSS